MKFVNSCLTLITSEWNFLRPLNNCAAVPLNWVIKFAIKNSCTHAGPGDFISRARMQIALNAQLSPGRVLCVTLNDFPLLSCHNDDVWLSVTNVAVCLLLIIQRRSSHPFVVMDASSARNLYFEIIKGENWAFVSRFSFRKFSSQQRRQMRTET